MEPTENTIWIDDFGPYLKPIYNIIKKITGLTIPFLDFLSPTFLLFPLVPLSPPDTPDLEENVCDMCGEFTSSYVSAALDTEINEIDDEQLENKIKDIENKLRTISVELIASINHRENLSLKIDHLHNQIMAIDSPKQTKRCNSLKLLAEVAMIKSVDAQSNNLQLMAIEPAEEKITELKNDVENIETPGTEVAMRKSVDAHSKNLQLMAIEPEEEKITELKNEVENIEPPGKKEGEQKDELLDQVDIVVEQKIDESNSEKEDGDNKIV